MLWIVIIEVEGHAFGCDWDRFRPMGRYYRPFEWVILIIPWKTIIDACFFMKVDIEMVSIKSLWAIISKAVRNWRPKMPENNFSKVSTLWTCQTYMENMSTVLKPGVSGNDFWEFGNGNGNSSTHSQSLGTGMGMTNCIHNFWEWEREWKLPSRLLGTGMRRWYSREWSGTGTGMTFRNPI